MYLRGPYSVRFRQAREQAGLSVEEAARRMSLSLPLLRDIEGIDDDLISTHSPADLQRFCRVLNVRPCILLGTKSSACPITADDLATFIAEHCQTHAIDLDEFEYAAGWCVIRSLHQPRRFLHDYSVNGIRDICYELDVDWERFVLSL